MRLGEDLLYCSTARDIPPLSRAMATKVCHPLVDNRSSSTVDSSRFGADAVCISTRISF